jgi:hypothetical protein
MDVLLMSLPQLLELYIKDFISLFEFFPVFITLLRVVRILLAFMWSHKGQKLIWSRSFFFFRLVTKSRIVGLPFSLLEILTVSSYMPKA